jgi:glycosyltransferase involved in cell wall biosynthesis
VRIAHVNLAKGFRGGERQTVLLVSELASRGIDQVVVTRRGGALAERMPRGPCVRVERVDWPFVHRVGVCRGCDLVHAQDGKALGFAALASTALGVPYVVTRRIATPPGRNPWSRAGYAHADALVALSRGVRDTMERATRREDVWIVPSAVARLPVDPERVTEIRVRYRGRFLVVCASALDQQQKGQSHLIAAAAALVERAPSVHVLLLGAGPDEARFRKAAEKLANVEFGGFVDDVGSYLAAADALALPSLHEGLGSIVLDAFAAGLPVIATRIPGIVDAVRDGDNGLLVPPGDSVALAGALERLCGDEGLAARLAEGARRAAIEFAPERMAERYIALYEELVRPGGAG